MEHASRFGEIAIRFFSRLNSGLDSTLLTHPILCDLTKRDQNEKTA